MADKTVSFALKLEDETSGAAKDAAQSLSTLQDKIDADTKALREMQKALRNLKGGTTSSSAQFKNLRDKIKAQRESLAQSQSSFLSLKDKLGSTSTAAGGLTTGIGKAKDKLGSTSTAAGGFTTSIGKAADGLKKMGGPMAKAGASLSSFAALLTNPITIIGVLVAALLALAAATVTVIVTLARYAISQSDARREEALRIEGLSTLRTWQGRVTASTEEMMSALDRASDSTNVGRGQLATYARQLSRMGIQGRSLTSTLEAMAIAQQVQGDRGAARFRAQIANARATGRSVEEVAESYRRRLGPIARRQMLSLTNQSNRLRQSLDRIFSGLNIEGFLGAIEQVQSLFSQSTATGRALKAIVEALFQPMIDQLEVLGPIARRFFQGMVIAALLVTIGFLRLRNALREAFGDTTLFDNVDLLQVALFAGAAAMIVFLVVLAAAAAVLVALVALVAFWTALMIAVPTIITAAAAAVTFWVASMVDAISEVNFEQLGIDLVEGLVRGLRNGQTAVVGAVRGLATSAQNAFRGALGISSPSRVFANFGMDISRGVAQGVDAGAPIADAAVEDIVGVPDPVAAGGSTAISFGNIIIGDVGDRDARDIADAIRDELASILEGVLIELGAT